MQSLTHLSLAHIKLTELPPSISVLSQLRSLDLTGNELEGGLEMLPTGLTILRADTASQKGPWLSRLLSLERLMSSSPVSAQDAPHMSVSRCSAACGAVVLWCCGAVVPAVLWCLRCCGAVVLWCCGAVVLWCCGACGVCFQHISVQPAAHLCRP